MKYKHKINGTESTKFWSFINDIHSIFTEAKGIPCPFVPINEICVVDFQLNPNWGALDTHRPYLADKGDVIAFDKKHPMQVKFSCDFSFDGNGNKTLKIKPLWDLKEWAIYPLIATLMHEANDIDVSDDNFRAWLIANRPKVNKAEKMDIPEKNNELFKFLQLRERSGDVKITQEMGQELFKALFDRANAIAHEEVSSDALATDTSEFMLALVNNIINSAPKPATRFDRVELKDFIRMNAMYMKENGRPLLSGEDYYIDGADEADALRVLGEPCSTVTNHKVWYFNMYGRIICRVYSAGHELVLNIARGTLLNMRKKVLDDVTAMLIGGRLNGKK